MRFPQSYIKVFFLFVVVNRETKKTRKSNTRVPAMMIHRDPFIKKIRHSRIGSSGP